MLISCFRYNFHRPTSTFSFPHFFNVLAEKEKLRSRATLYYAHSSTLIPVSLQRVFDLFCHTIISSLCLGLFYTNTESAPLVKRITMQILQRRDVKNKTKHVMTQLHYIGLLWFCLLWRVYAYILVTIAPGF